MSAQDPAPAPSPPPSPTGGQAPDTTLSLVEAQIADTPSIVVPLTGQVVDLTRPVEVAGALQDVREVKRQLDELRSLLEGVLRLEALRQGTKTLHLGPLDAVISGGERSEYDAELLSERLRDAGLPEDRLAEAVVQTVSYKVDQRVLRQLAAANPAYKTAVDKSRTVVDTPWRVSVKGATR
jgi:hypothetical protein